MSGSMSRRKGATGEREVAHLLGVSRNARNGISTGDLALPADCPYHIEVKRWGRGTMSDLYAALDQAVADAQAAGTGQSPVVVVRTNRREWLAVQWLGDATWLMDAVKETPR